MENKKIKTPNEFVEVFLSLFKWMLLAFTVLTLALVGLFGLYIQKSFNGIGYQISQEQSGFDNVQGIDNVSKTNG